MIKLSEEQNHIIKKLLQDNSYDYNKLKASEEFQELALILTQSTIRKTRIEDQAIIDEIGDCIIRLEILKQMFDINEIQKRIDFKLRIFKQYQDSKQYTQI
jgi:hypothetical protein